MKRVLFIGVTALIASQAFAQTPDSRSTPATQPRGAAAVDAGPATPTGQEVNVSLGGYTYVEPGDLRISIHGLKVGAEYTATLPLSRRRHWFAQADVRGSLGNVSYDGWCLPWLITPNSASPNGYELDLGEASPCSESGDRDWYVEGRALAGKDFIGQKWTLSPYAGLGVRHLSNGTTGIPGFRTDTYLYPAVGATARTRVASRVLGFNLEYDQLIRGWQQTRDSELGSGFLPPTPTAPGFTIDGFTDLAFDQHRGWALRASAKYQVTGGWSVEPYYVRWSVGASPVSRGTVTFTVNGVTAREQLGAYEPFNTTDEFGMKLGFRF